VREWRQQFDKVESVDLRYDRQIIVNPDLNGAMKQAPLSASAAKKAVAAGVKPAVLISHVPVGPKSLAAAPATTAANAPVKPATKRTVAKRRRSKAAAKKPRAKARARAAPAPKWTSKSTTLQGAAGKPNSVVPPQNASAAAKPAKKPSPAITREQGHP